MHPYESRSRASGNSRPNYRSWRSFYLLATEVIIKIDALGTCLRAPTAREPPPGDAPLEPEPSCAPGARFQPRHLDQLVHAHLRTDARGRPGASADAVSARDLRRQSSESFRYPGAVCGPAAALAPPPRSADAQGLFPRPFPPRRAQPGGAAVLRHAVLSLGAPVWRLSPAAERNRPAHRATLGGRVGGGGLEPADLPRRPAQ